MPDTIPDLTKVHDLCTSLEARRIACEALGAQDETDKTLFHFGGRIVHLNAILGQIVMHEPARSTILSYIFSCGVCSVQWAVDNDIYGCGGTDALERVSIMWESGVPEHEAWAYVVGQAVEKTSCNR